MRLPGCGHIHLLGRNPCRPELQTLSLALLSRSYGPVKHKKEHPTIRVCAGPGTAVSADPEDPVTASLLGTAAPSSASSTTPDMTIVNARAKLQCFVAVLKYWKVVLEPLLADAKRDDVYKNLEHIITVAGQ